MLLEATLTSYFLISYGGHMTFKVEMEPMALKVGSGEDIVTYFSD
jgi:hypothetical protein